MQKPWAIGSFYIKRLKHSVIFTLNVGEMALGKNFIVFSCNQTALWMILSDPLSISHLFFTMFLSLYCHQIVRNIYHWQKGWPSQGQGHRSKVRVTEVKKIAPIWGFLDHNSITITGKAWCGIGKMSYCFSKSSIKFQGHTRKNCWFWPKLGVSRL